MRAGGIAAALPKWATMMLATLALGAMALATGARAADSSASSSSSSPPGLAHGESLPNPRVRVTTNLGSFVIELYQDRAPITVANFLFYVRKGQYTNTLFHRVISNFVIQGGGHDATGPDYKLKPVLVGLLPGISGVPNESGNGLKNLRGTVGLARAGSPHSGNCQFYINLVDNPELDPIPTRWGYAVFGGVIQGMDVVDRIGVTPTGSNCPDKAAQASCPFKSDWPLTPVVIEKVEQLPAGAVLQEAPVAPAPSSTTPPVATPK
jgi:peptidyl-prolyl cis-trans isomerase A (cyclophilin A)